MLNYSCELGKLSVRNRSRSALCNIQIIVSSNDLQFMLPSLFAFHLEVCLLNGIWDIIDHGHMC